MVDQAIMKRIAALLQKTVDNGCTEEEAAAAAAMASNMMHKFQISQSAAELGAEGMVHVNLHPHESPAMVFGVEFEVRFNISIVAEKYCGVKQWGNAAEWKIHRDRGLHLVGLKSDVDMATWMIDTLSVVAWRLAVEHTAHVPGERRTHRKNFIRGFKDGLYAQAVRLMQERETNHQDVLSDGKSLLVVKQELVNDKLEDMGMKLKQRSTFITNAEMYKRGAHEGINANLGRPIQANTQRLLS